MGCHTNSRENQGTQVFSLPLPFQCDKNEPKLISMSVMKKWYQQVCGLVTVL